jgi:glyceraldehyde 3-phosphate dehydrogenase
MRFPVPNGSLVVLNLEVSKETSVNEVNAIMKKYALEGGWWSKLNIRRITVVSSDIVGTSAPSIYDS